MSTWSSSVFSNLRRQVLQLFEQYKALLYLLNAVDVNERPKLDAQRNAIPRISRPKLLEARERLKQEIAKLRRMYGAKKQPQFYVNFLRDFREDYATERDRHGVVFLGLPKYFISELFGNYGATFPEYRTFPAHARIGIDLYGDRDDLHVIEVYVLEMMLYEDMCALFNLAKRSNEVAIRPESTKRMVKESNALKHACVTAAFYFVEAYLNGIAFDFYANNDETLSEKEIEILTEWDAARQKPRHISLRDKLLQYPRIITKAGLPPLTEDNCPELKSFLGKAQLIRDSVVHASPKLNLDTLEPVKEKCFSNPQIADCKEAVDTAIKLVRKIETTVRGSEERLSWLKGRCPDGFFDDSVFR